MTYLSEVSFQVKHVCFITLLIASCIVYVDFWTSGDLLSKDSETESFRSSEENVRTGVGSNTAADQLNRINHFRQVCKSMELVSNNLENMTLQVVYSKKYKLAYRLVPKIGSTFLMQAFNILSGTKTARYFKVARMHVHSAPKRDLKDILPLSELDDYTVLILGRNPFSRIFSAYIDKVYLLNSIGLNLNIFSKLYGKNATKTLTKSCNFNIGFDQFLQYIFNDSWEFNPYHCRPILSIEMCKVMCNLRHILIVKQESFSDDIEYALRLAGVKGEEYDIIYDEMHSKQAESTVAGIVKTLYEKTSGHMKTYPCLKWQNIAQSLWKSFQIQGYIHEESDFNQVKHRLKGRYDDPEFLIEIITQEIQQRPLSHQEKVKQRNRALLQAYSNIQIKHIREIQEHYARDFLMFQYSMDLDFFRDVLI